MAEARAAVTRPNVSLNAEGTGTTEAELELLKSTFRSLKKCAFRTRYVFMFIFKRTSRKLTVFGIKKT